MQPPALLEPRVLMMTDIVDSTRIFAALGETAAAQLWAAHDQGARALMHTWAARELERGDGFFLLFERMADAHGFALGYHRLLAGLPTALSARVAIHFGPVRVRHNSEDEVQRGARPLDIDGQAKPITARIQSMTLGGQTLASASATDALDDTSARKQSHGHWQFKGVAEPVEMFELGDEHTHFSAPPDAEKAWRVVRRGEHWLPAREVPHTLIAERDRFVGRSEHLHQLAQALSQSRLVSLLGIGGTGKTRLALRHGWAHLGEHPGGVWFCDLSAATTPAGIVHAVAQGLQLPLGAADPVQQVGHAIAGRGDCLVILDNFEQVARHAEATLGQWLQRASQAHFLVTTREVLGIVGEYTLALPPLSAAEGQALLRERATAAGALPFAPADEAAVTQLVQLLDGLPLAIELAASRMRLLGPAQLLPRMNQRFALLTSRGGRHDRQATLRATLDWSWDLLTEPERCTLAQLSVFEGGFTLEAAQAVVDLSGTGEAWVFDTLLSLVDKSLVRPAAHQRFELLRSVQEYAAERLALPAAGGAAAASAASAPQWRHLQYYAAFDEEQAGAYQCVETGNLVMACRRALWLDQPQLACAALVTAWEALKLTGPYTFAAQLAEQVLASLPPGLALPARWVAASALYLLGDINRARAELETVLASDDPVLLCKACCALGELESTGGSAQRAEALLDQALGLARQATQPALQCRALNGLGALAADQGRLDEARGHYQAALSMARACGSLRWEGGLLGNLGGLAHAQGQFDQADDFYQAALRIAGQVGDRRWEGNTRCNLGLLHLEQQCFDQAVSELRTALQSARGSGDLRLQCVVLNNLGLLAESQGRWADALGLFADAGDAAQRLHDRHAEGLSGAYAARVLARLGRGGAASQHSDRAQRAMDGLDDDFCAGLIACAEAEIALLAGRPQAARKHHQQARAHLLRGQLGEGSELGRELQRLGPLLASDQARTEPPPMASSAAAPPVNRDSR